jgi:two-component system, NarL family, response regulator NreC
MTSAIRILLADDHSVLRAGLIALLDAESDIVVVGEAADGVECLEQALALRPDIILMDINMPNCGGLEALGSIRLALPDTRVLILTMHDDIGYLKQVLSTGGSGYILKQAASEELLAAIHTVNDGGIFIHPHHAQALARDSATADDMSTEKSGNALERRYGSLSDRESEVFRLLALGHSNGEIAELMFLSVKTVETYKARLMRKLQIASRAELVHVALELGILSR